MKTGAGSITRPVLFERIAQFLGEAGRRRVWRTAFAYAAVVFVLLQLGEIVFPAFGVPEGALRLLVVACFLGFPLVLALAWAFDITSDGIQRTHSGEGSSSQSGYSGTTLPRLTLLAVIMVTVAGVGWWTVQDTLKAQTPIPSGSSDGFATLAAMEDSPLQVRSLAVLPLEDFSEEEGGEYFTAGFHEELISQLSQIGAARVISRTSVVQYDATGKTMPLIAADLGVEGVVEGSVFRDGDRVRITVQLIHGPTDQHLWANSYDGTLEDAIGLQRRVAQAIAKEIQAELFPEERWETPETRVAGTPRVQEEYMKGRYDQSKATPEALESAIVHFEAALEGDSTFAPAYAGLAAARFLLGIQSKDSLDPHPLTDRGIVEPLEIAFHLDEDSPEAQAVLLSLQESFGEVPGIELPDGIRILGDSAFLLEADIALTATEFGRQLHRVVIQQGLKTGSRSGASHSQRLTSARRLQATSDFRTAEAVIREAIEAAPESAEAWDALERLKATQRDFQGVAGIRQERLAQNPPGPKEEASLRRLESRLEEEGEEGYWSWRMEDLQEREEGGEKISPVILARTYMGLDRTDEAFQELEAAVEKRDRNLISLWTDPAWDSVRTDPRFRKIMMDLRRTQRSEGTRFPGWH
jgi:TolB-like protein